VTERDDPDIRAQAGAVVDLLRARLADDLLAVYLSGSATAGGLRADSDLDLVAVVRRRLSSAEKLAIVTGVTPLSHRPVRPAGWRPVELTVLVADDIRPWRYPPRMELQYGEWLREEFDAGRIEPASPENPDLALLVTEVLAHGRALVGPSPGSHFDTVPVGDVVRAMIAGIPMLLEDLATDTRNVLLTLARIHCTLSTGSILPKHVAAAWALERLPWEHRPVLELARRGYLGADDDWDGRAAEVDAHARFVVERIERIAVERDSGGSG
jgi:streptomycin 3"-adenylyltransferase